MSEEVAPDAAGASALVRATADTIRRILDPLVPRGSRCALVDFPAYANVGDSAIWLGQRAYLRDRGARIVYTCQHSSYSSRRLARRLGDGVILLQGGGNLGDVWPQHQRLREQVMADFPGSKIIQLPQTIRFRDPANLARARDAFKAHGKITLLVRDRPSLALAQDGLGQPATLCPDMSFVLGTLAPPARAACDILWLARSDLESRGLSPPPLGAGEESTDWTQERPSLLPWLSQARARQSMRHPRLLGGLARFGAWLYDAEARERLDRGRRLLARGHVLITDRLHGHILALLAGQPHVVIDTVDGKIRGFWDAWTLESPLTTWAENPADALARARALVRAMPRGSTHAAR